MKPITVLIVDNHSVMRRTLKKVFKYEKNISVIGEANDGFEAIRKTKELQPELVLMDVKMPKMDGLKAAQLIKLKYPKTKIIILSAYNHKDLIEKAIKLGVSAYILKVYPVEDIVKTILLKCRRKGNRQRVHYFPKDFEQLNGKDHKEEGIGFEDFI